MDQRRVETVKDIARQRRLLGDEIAELSRRVEDTVSWRRYFEKNTWAALGMAVSGGFLLGKILARKS